LGRKAKFKYFWLVLQGDGAGDDFRYVELEDTDCNPAFPSPQFNTDHFGFPSNLHRTITRRSDFPWPSVMATKVLPGVHLEGKMPLQTETYNYNRKLT